MRSWLKQGNTEFIHYDVDKLRKAHFSIAATAGELSIVDDGIPTDLASELFGALPNFAAAATAIAAVCSTLRSEYVRAELLLNQVVQVMDLNLKSTMDTEFDNTELFRPQSKVSL